MTEQERFHFGYVCGDTGLIDEKAELKWFIENCCSITDLKKNWKTVCDKLNELNDENEELRQENKKILDTINNKITEKGMEWYGAEDGSKEEKEANLQLNVLEEIRDELKEKLNEDDKMRWSKKTENTVQDSDGEEYNIDEIVKALNHYQDSVDSLSKENYDMYCLIEEFCLNAKDMIMTFRERRKNND